MNSPESPMDPSREANREVAAGYFRDTKKAERAVTALRQAGFAQIGIASRKSDDAEKMADRTDAKAGLAVSSASGGVLEETGGESDYADPQDVQATLVAAHIPEDQARGFQEKLQHGGALVTVETVAPRGTEARRLLESEGAEDSGSSTTGYAATPAPATTPVHEPPRAAAPETAAGAHVFNLHGELLRIHKERVQRGEVRLRKETVTEHQNINVPVTHEQVVIERSPAAEGTPASSSADEAREVRIPLTQEKVSVEKQPVVTEQVRVAKKEVQDTQPVREELRHDELEVESEGNLTPEEREALRRGEKPRRAA